MNGRPINEIVVDRPGSRAERKGFRILLTEVEPAAPRVIEQDSVAAAWAARGNEKRNASVQRIRRFLKAVRIGVPESERLAAAIERTRLVAQAEYMFFVAEFLAQQEAAVH